MAKLFVTDSNLQQHQLEIESGLSLMEHLRNADFDEVQAGELSASEFSKKM